MKGELTEGPALRRLVAFGLPLVVGSVAHSLFNLVDVWLVGRYAPVALPAGSGIPNVPREAALAAIHASSVLNFIPMLVANGISTATIATVSRSIGAKDGRRAADVVNRSMVVSLILGLVMGILCGVFSRPQLNALEVTSEAYETADRCLQIMSYGSVTMFALLQVTAIERAVGRSIPPLVILTGANIMNAIAAVYAIPRWGAIGAAWATVISRGIFALIGIAWLYGRFSEFRVRIGSLVSVWKDSLQLLRLAGPASLQIFARALAVLLITRFVATTAVDGVGSSESTDAVAAYSVALRLEMIAMFMCVGWGSATAAAVGQNLGAGNSARAIRMGWHGAWLAAGGMILLGAAFYLWAPQLFAIFLEDEDPERLASIVRLGTGYFRIVAFSYAFVGVGIVLAEGVNGAGATRFSFFVDFIAYVIVLSVLAIVLGNQFGLLGLWAALLSVHVVVAIVYALSFGRVLRSRGHPAA